MIINFALCICPINEAFLEMHKVNYEVVPKTYKNAFIKICLHVFWGCHIGDYEECHCLGHVAV
jgi:hypothetical protein